MVESRDTLKEFRYMSLLEYSLTTLDAPFRLEKFREIYRVPCSLSRQALHACPRIGPAQPLVVLPMVALPTIRFAMNACLGCASSFFLFIRGTSVSRRCHSPVDDPGTPCFMKCSEMTCESSVSLSFIEFSEKGALH